jgi:glutaminyl-tRNA synthetase
MENNVYHATLKSLSLEDKTIAEVAKNAKLCENIKSIVDSLGVTGLDKRQGNLMYTLVAKSHWMTPQKVLFVASFIKDSRIASMTQLDEAFAFFKQYNDIDMNKDENVRNFEERSGVGFSYTADDIKDYVTKFIANNLKEVSEKPNHPGNLAKLRDGLKFADRKLLIDTYNEACKNLTQVKIEKKEEPTTVVEGEKKAEDDEKETIRKYRTEKLLARDLSASLNNKEVLEAHQARTGGCVVTRFPPEPNGYLHIGHCKAMRFNFKLAADYNGYTYLRYDDTNPEAESQEYIDQIKENVLWMGYTPKKITYASDNFDKIYEIALELIRKGKAFVCKLSKEEAKVYRDSREPSPYRNTPPEVNLREFQLMKAGFYAEGQACLRAKIDYKSNNTTLQDPTIYRIKFVPHPHIGDKWCIYPLYDFTHSLCDSFEDITHSLCTLEFEGRRDLYYWSLNELNMYKPYVWEYSRLNITYNVLSKRKLLKLVTSKYVDGWDDPRLLTIAGIRRRGYPPEAINNFCDLISVSRRGNDNVIQYSVLEHCIRQYLFEHAPHTFAVLEPVELELTNLSSRMELDTEEFGYRFGVEPVIYVDRSDVRLEDSKDFYGIAPGKIVRLKFGPFVRITEVTPQGDSFKVKGEIVPESEIPNYKKIKGVLHFIEKSAAINCEVRVYDRLFTNEYPGEPSGDILADFNKESKRVITNAKIHRGLIPALKPESRFQFERLGYFYVDPDSNHDAKEFVFNKIVSLKESDKIKALGKN